MAKAAPKARAAPSEPVLPTEEEAELTGARIKVKKTNAKARKAPELRAGALAELVGEDPKPKPKAKAKGRPRKIPAGSRGGKVTIKRVQITSPEAGVMKKVRGRPKGAMGKVKRDLATMG